MAIDISQISSTTDCLLLANGHVGRHVSAIAHKVQKKMRERGIRPAHVEGLQHGEWVVLDYSFLIVHLFTPEMRQRYQLERVWHEGCVLDLSLPALTTG